MKNEVEKAKREVALIIKDEVKKSWGSHIDLFNTVFLAGGGAKELEPYLLDIYPRTVLVSDPQMANVKGFLKVAELQEKM